MGATSVTGTGRGEAGITRGPNNGRNQYYSLVDPHVVWHGTVELDGLTTVYLPSSISVPPTHLTVFIGGKGYIIEKLVGADGMMTGFTVAGYGDAVDYIVVDANNACFGQFSGV